MAKHKNIYVSPTGMYIVKKTVFGKAMYIGQFKEIDVAIIERDKFIEKIKNMKKHKLGKEEIYRQINQIYKIRNKEEKPKIKIKVKKIEEVVDELDPNLIEEIKKEVRVDKKVYDEMIENQHKYEELSKAQAKYEKLKIKKIYKEEKYQFTDFINDSAEAFKKWLFN